MSRLPMDRLKMVEGRHPVLLHLRQPPVDLEALQATKLHS